MPSLKNNLDHSRAAYLFAVRSIPSKLPISIYGFHFEKPSQINSMLIELGWAFFCRYEACLEAYLKSRGVKLSRKVSLLEWFEQNNFVLSDFQKNGLFLYRKIRNKLHHEDGAALDGERDHEIHLLPEHMENFYNLFVWCGTTVEEWANKSLQRMPRSGAADL
jgi:hypothetical protein